MKELDLAQRQAIMLNTMKEIHEFCEKENITYFLAYGTLLGAIRHNGFIPWDDDLDIMMPRPDFDKFIKCYQMKNSYHVNFNARNGFEFVFSRIINKQTYRLTKKNIVREGIFIDVYPIEGLPSDKSLQQKMIKQIKACVKMRHHLRIIRAILKKLNLWWKRSDDFYPLYLACKIQNKTQTKYDYTNSDEVLCCAGKAANRTPLDKSIFKSRVLHQFEDSKFYIPTEYDKFLRCRYGDYMQLPPMEDRTPYHAGNYFMS